jgi:hypothetical protein
MVMKDQQSQKREKHNHMYGTAKMQKEETKEIKAR